MLVEIFNVGSAICFFERMMSNGFHCKPTLKLNGTILCPKQFHLRCDVQFGSTSC